MVEPAVSAITEYTTPAGQAGRSSRAVGHQGEGVMVARRTFSVVDVTEILVHWYAGRSIGEVARSLGVDRNTVRKYIAPAVAAGIGPGGEPISPQRWAELVRVWFPKLVSMELRHPKFAEIAPYHELIEQLRKTNTV